jgi:hypothetical protein
MNRLDGRTKAYKLHAQRLQAQRERRLKLKNSKSTVGLPTMGKTQGWTLMKLI